MRFLPDYFEKFCSILKTDPRYTTFVESMILCCVVFNSEEEIKEHLNIDTMAVYLGDLLGANEITALGCNVDSEAIRNGASREDYFVTMLKDKNLDFIKMFMKCLALDIPNNAELYQLLQSLADSLNDTVDNPSVMNLAVSVSLLEYKEHLRQFYLQNSKPVAEDNFEGPNINQYINLSLITPEQHGGDEYEYFKAIADPYSLLFKHKGHNNKTILKSLPEIFDVPGIGQQVILIQGSPGSGKTTLANEICRQWAKGALIQNYTLVIMLKLRDPRIVNMYSIDELIYCSTGNAHFAFEAIQDIHSCHGRNSLLILEGWDELHEDKQRDSFLADIISRKLFKDASVLITSRPSSIGTIQKIFVTRHIAILGFSEDQVKLYLTNCLEGKLRDRFLTELDSHLALKSLACTPVNLSILVHVFKQCGERLPSSLTELYQQYLLFKLSHYNLRMENTKKIFEQLEALPDYINGQLKHLSNIAFQELIEENFTIDEDRIRHYYGQAIPIDFDGMGLLKVENHIMHKSNYRTFSFLHRTIQEFVAAWYLTKLPSNKQEMMFINILDNKACEMSLLFYAGLTGLRTINIEIVLSAVINKELAKKFLLSMVSVDLQLVLKNSNAAKLFRISTIAKDYYTEVTSNTFSNDTLLVLISCCAEAQNPAACKTLCSSALFYSDACYIDIPDSALTSQVLSSLSYCIVHSGKKWVVDCPYLNITEILCLHKFFESNNISGELAALHTYADKHQIEYFMMIIQSQCQLSFLDLSNSKAFDDHCVTVLADTLAHNESLTYLQLRNCNISSEGLFTIAKMLQINDVLEWINLELNDFSSDDLNLAIQEMGNNASLLFLEVDYSLIDKGFKESLSRFNEDREPPLRMHIWEVFRGYDVVDRGLKKVNKVKAFFKDLLD